MRSSTPVHVIAALGSSFAAGPTLKPVVDPDAMRSASNYPHLLAHALDATLIDLTVSGATTANILDEPQTTMTGAQYAPQIDGVPADADVVTVTAGGNDLNFLGSLLFTAWSQVAPDGPITRLMAEQFVDGLPTPTPAAIEAAADGLVRIVQQARIRAPDAAVVLVDYLTVIPATGTPVPGDLFDTEQTTLFLAIQEALAEAFRVAAERSGAQLLAMSAKP